MYVCIQLLQLTLSDQSLKASIGIQAGTKQQRHCRLQIARDNTACRTTKQTPTASTKCCYVQREQVATTSTGSK